MKTFIVTIFIVLSVYIAHAQLSGTYIVGGPNADYPNPSIAIQTVVQQGVSGPVIFEIYPGIYQVKEAIPPILGSSIQNTVTFMSQTQNVNDVEFYNTTNDNASSYIILLNGGQNIVFKYLKFCQKGKSSGCIRINNYSGNIKFIGNTFMAPFYTMSSGCPLVGVYLNGFLSGGFQFLENTFYNGLCAIHLFSSSIYNKAVISSNNIRDVYCGVVVSNADSVVVFNNSINVLDVILGVDNTSYFSIDRNYLKNRVGSAHYLVSLGLTKSPNNEVSNFSNNSVIGYGMKGMSITNNKNLFVFNNTILTRCSKNYVASIKVELNTNLNFQNNILTNDSSCFLAAIKNNSNSTFDYNVFYTQNDTIFNDGFNIHTSLASWQTATGYDAHSVFVKPNFSKLNDVHLQANNPQIIGAGTPLAQVNLDIDGEVRDATRPDIGADEYSLRPILDSVIWGCAGSIVTLDAGAGFSSYLWTTNVSAQQITVDTSGVGLGQVLYGVTVSYGSNSSSANTKVVWQNCTGFLDYQQQKIDVKLFPNPSNGIVHIDLPNSITDYSVYVYNSNGKLIVKKNNVRHLNLSEYPKGLYFIQIHTDESSVMRKLILQ